jgi:hypothetical protein
MIPTSVVCPLSVVDSFATKVAFSVSLKYFGSCLVRVTSWIVRFVHKNKDDPRSHTNQHEPQYFRLELDVTFEAKLPFVMTSTNFAAVSKLKAKSRPVTHEQIVRTSLHLPVL